LHGSRRGKGELLRKGGGVWENGKGDVEEITNRGTNKVQGELKDGG